MVFDTYNWDPNLTKIIEETRLEEIKKARKKLKKAQEGIIRVNIWNVYGQENLDYPTIWKDIRTWGYFFLPNTGFEYRKVFESAEQYITRLIGDGEIYSDDIADRLTVTKGDISLCFDFEKGKVEKNVKEKLVFNPETIYSKDRVEGFVRLEKHNFILYSAGLFERDDVGIGRIIEKPPYGVVFPKKDISFIVNDTITK